MLDATSGELAGGEKRSVRVRAGNTGVPGGAAAVVVQVLARGADAEGYLTVQPAGSQKDQRPVLAFDRRGTQRTLVVVPVGDDGKIAVTSKLAGATVSLRLVGWYS